MMTARFACVLLVALVAAPFLAATSALAADPGGEIRARVVLHAGHGATLGELEEPAFETGAGLHLTRHSLPLDRPWVGPLFRLRTYLRVWAFGAGVGGQVGGGLSVRGPRTELDVAFGWETIQGAETVFGGYATVGFHTSPSGGPGVGAELHVFAGAFAPMINVPYSGFVLMPTLRFLLVMP